MIRLFATCVALAALPASAETESEASNGRYMAVASSQGSAVWVLDTKTGAMKICGPVKDPSKNPMSPAAFVPVCGDFKE